MQPKTVSKHPLALERETGPQLPGRSCQDLATTSTGGPNGAGQPLLLLLPPLNWVIAACRPGPLLASPLPQIAGGSAEQTGLPSVLSSAAKGSKSRLGAADAQSRPQRGEERKEGWAHGASWHTSSGHSRRPGRKQDKNRAVASLSAGGEGALLGLCMHLKYWCAPFLSISETTKAAFSHT